MRFIITVGKIIMADAQLEPGDIKEGDNIPSVQKSPLSRPSAVSILYFCVSSDGLKSLLHKHS